MTLNSVPVKRPHTFDVSYSADNMIKVLVDGGKRGLFLLSKENAIEIATHAETRHHSKAVAVKLAKDLRWAIHLRELHEIGE